MKNSNGRVYFNVMFPQGGRKRVRIQKASISPSFLRESAFVPRTTLLYVLYNIHTQIPPTRHGNNG